MIGSHATADDLCPNLAANLVELEYLQGLLNYVVANCRSCASFDVVDLPSDSAKFQSNSQR